MLFKRQIGPGLILMLVLVQCKLLESSVWLFCIKKTKQLALVARAVREYLTAEVFYRCMCVYIYIYISKLPAVRGGSRAQNRLGNVVMCHIWIYIYIYIYMYNIVVGIVCCLICCVLCFAMLMYVCWHLILIVLFV